MKTQDVHKMNKQATNGATGDNGKLYTILSVLVLIISFALGALAYPHLPAKVAIHWNAAGVPDGYTGPLGGALMLPLIMTGTFGLLTVLPYIDPKRSNYALMGRVYGLVRFAIMLFMGLVHVGTLATAFGYLKAPSFILPGVGILFIVIGNYMGKVKYNYTFGLRTPWTLASEEVWYKTHRTVGPLWMLGGVIFLVSSFLPTPWHVPLIIGVALGLSLLSFIYSFYLYRQLPRKE